MVEKTICGTMRGNAAGRGVRFLIDMRTVYVHGVRRKHVAGLRNYTGLISLKFGPRSNCVTSTLCSQSSQVLSAGLQGVPRHFPVCVLRCVRCLAASEQSVRGVLCKMAI